MSPSPASRVEELPDDDQAPAARPTAVASAATATDTPLHDSTSPATDEDDSDDDNPEDSWWTPSELRDLLDHAQTLKQRGNTEFGQGRWEMALGTYREGLKELPVRRGSIKGKERALPPDDDTESNSASRSQAGDVDEAAELNELSELRAILAANVAACLLKLERWKEAVEACDQALEDKADYAKAIHRRALANEALGSWGSLTASLEDFNKLATIPGNSSLLEKQIKLAQARLPKKIEVQQAKEKEEVVGKLKDLGNVVLGKFGLSTDNFKLQEQPGGGYGISFQR